MTHHEPCRLFNLRMYSCRTRQERAVFPQKFRAQAFFTSMGATAGHMPDAMRSVNRIHAAGRAHRSLQARTLLRFASGSASGMRALSTEFISVRRVSVRAPMNRSLGCVGFHGPVGLLDSRSSILNLSEGVFHGNDC